MSLPFVTLFCMSSSTSFQAIFPGYYRLTEAEIAQTWSEGLVCVDTNILLNCYRYSESTRKVLLEVLAHFDKRLWIPYQVAKEFHRRRLELIHGQIKNCNEWIKVTRESMAKLDDRRQHPFVSAELRRQIDQTILEIEREITGLTGLLESYWTDDPIVSQLSALFDKKIGPPMDDLQTARKEASQRYGEETPPGYKDKNKPGDDGFGDYFLWRQLLAHAREHKVPVMFVTDDEKDDWWYKVGGKTFGPQPALVDEMRKASGGKPFVMYTAERFLEFANKNRISSNSKVAEAVKEAKEARGASVSALEEVALQKTPTRTSGQTESLMAGLLSSVAGLLIGSPAVSTTASSAALLRTAARAQDHLSSQEKLLLDQKAVLESRLESLNRRLESTKRLRRFESTKRISRNPK